MSGAVRSALHLEDFVAGRDINVVGNEIVVTGNRIVLPAAPPPPRDQRWLDELHRYVRREVDQWLEDEIGEEPLLHVDKQELSEAVGRRRPVLVSARDDDRLLDASEALGDVFVEEAGRSLLILGEPGSGKSVLLRRLARDLLDRSGPEEPVPVLLDLAGWTDDGRPFVDWLASADGLRRSYRSIGDAQLRTWLRDGRLTLLLDGLDEVQIEHRAACATALNAFVAGEGGGAPGGLAVCSRIEEYRAVAREVGSLDLGAAIYLQPLSEEQVGRYLEAAGPHTQGLRAAWEADEGVRELARNPLMLSTMSLAFERPQTFASATEEPLRDRLLGAYVERVFERAEERAHVQADADPFFAESEGDVLPFGRAEVGQRLGWLALRLREHARSTFYVEEVQPSWLPARRRTAYIVASRGASGLVLGVTAGALLLLGLGLSRTLFGVGEAVGTGALVVGLSVAGALLVSGLDAFRMRSGAERVPGGRAVWLVGLVAVMGGAGSALFELGGQRGTYGLLFGLLWGVVVAVVFEPAAAWRSAGRDVRLVEPLRWSRRSAFRAARRSLVAGAVVGAALGGVIAWSRLSGGAVAWAVVVVVAIAGGGLAGVVGGTLGGLKRGNARAAPRHNLGFRLSIRNAVFAGGVTALAATTVLGALSLASGALGWGGVLRVSLGGGLFCGLLAALRYGGVNAVYHATLRVLLHRAGHLPLRAASFFRFVTDLSLVRSAGGGYAFTHRLFAEYFADRMHTPDDVPSDAPVAARVPVVVEGD